MPHQATPPSLQNLDDLKHSLRQFAQERDWEQFHSPKNLSMALIAEAAELLEHFQWLTEGQSADLPEQTHQQVKEELADVLVYLVRIADKLNIDLLAAAEEKLQINARKYPVDKARGRADKYTAYEEDVNNGG